MLSNAGDEVVESSGRITTALDESGDSGCSKEPCVKPRIGEPASV